MFTSILNRYNPKDPRTHGILKYFSEGLSENENISFVEELFKSGSWLLPTEISRVNISDNLREKTSNYFYQIFNNWVLDRIEFSNRISSKTRNPYITSDLHFQFRQAILSIKNLDFPKEMMKTLEGFVLNTNPLYLEKFLEGEFWVVTEEYEEKDIEIFLGYFIDIYIANKSANFGDFIYSSLNGLAFTHKIYYLSNEFQELLLKLSKTITEIQTPNNYKLLKCILLIDLIRNKKLDLYNSKYKGIIKSTLDSLESGNYDNLDILLFLKKFNYSFIDYNILTQAEALFEKINDMLLRIQKRPDIEKQALFHHLLKSYNEYFELLLFYQELVDKEKAHNYFIRFINLIDEIRNSFSSMLWYDEFLEFIPITGELFNVIKEGFEVKIDDHFFKEKISEKKLQSKLSIDFISHFGYGFLHSKSLIGYYQALSFFKKSKQGRIELKEEEKENFEGINKFHISKLNYSASNKKNVLTLTPFKDSNHNLITKYNLKAFFSSIELFLIEKANNYLSIPSPFPKKSNALEIIIPPKYISEYNINFSEENFWEILKKFRPFLYKTIYLNHIKIIESVKKINYAFTNNHNVNGLIKSRSKGGMIVDILGVEAFLPGSEIDTKSIIDYDFYVAKSFDFKVLRVSEANQNIIVSRKQLIEAELKVHKDQVLGKLEKGTILEGKVKNIMDYGAFIDLGLMDGLLHITDMSWGRIQHPTEILKIDQKINVVVLDFNENKERIALGLKQLLSNPWDILEKGVNVGTKVSGKIVNIEDYRAFLELTPGVEGLIHISEITSSSYTANVREFFKVGDIHEVIILTIDREERKISLGMTNFLKNVWKKITSKYAIGTKHSLVIHNITHFGVFVDLGGFDGLIHLSKLSWYKKIKHPSEIAKIGDEINTVVVDIDEERRRISLMQDKVKEELLDRTTIFKGKIINYLQDRAVVSVDGWKINAYVETNHLIKFDGSLPKKGEILNFKVLRTFTKNKTILLSHIYTYRTVINKTTKRSKS